ncbi:MAG: biotin transporter BioY [Synechococcus sp.]
MRKSRIAAPKGQAENSETVVASSDPVHSTGHSYGARPDRPSSARAGVAGHTDDRHSVIVAATTANVEASDAKTSTSASTQHRKNWRSLIFSIKNDGIPSEYDVTRFPLPNPYELMWAALGVLVTAAGALLQVTIPNAWTIGIGPIQLAGYRFSFQLAGLLVTAFMGGARAALLSQLAYVGMGIAGFDIFMDGGGAAYIQRPAFGYLIGFIPGAWLCGRLAEMQSRTRPVHLFAAGLFGLLAVHATGIFYLLLQPLPEHLWQTLVEYSAYTAFGQLLVLIISVVVAVMLRVALLY